MRARHPAAILEGVPATIWSQKPGIELQFPNYPAQRLEEFLVSNDPSQGTLRGLGGMGPLAGMLEVGVIDELTCWGAPGGLEEDRCALTVHHPFLERQREQSESVL